MPIRLCAEMRLKNHELEPRVLAIGRDARPATLSYGVVRFSSMPRISSFYGIVIAMYFDEHPPAHFHARYGEYDAQIAIDNGEILHGTLPRRAHALVREWIELHQAELVANWEKARAERPLATIDPLP